MRERSRNIAPSPRLTLDQLRRWHLVKARCLQCRREAVIPHEVLRRGRQPYVGLLSLEARLRCKACGRLGGHLLTVEAMQRD